MPNLAEGCVEVALEQLAAGPPYAPGIPRVERTADNLRLGTDMVVLRDSDVLDDKVPVRIRSHPVPKRSALFLCYSRLLLEPRHRDMILMFSRAGPHA